MRTFCLQKCVQAPPFHRIEMSRRRVQAPGVNASLHWQLAGSME